MTHEELITTVSRKLDWPESQTARLIGALTALLKEKLLENLPVSIDDFGIFSTCMRPEFISLNPETKERYLIPPAIEVVFEHAAYLADPDLPQISFEPEESLRESVNSSFACFEPTRINEGVQFPDIPEIIAEEYVEEDISEEPEEYIEEEISEEPEEIDNHEISEKTDTLPVPEVFEEMEISEELTVFEEPVQHLTNTQYERDERHHRADHKRTKRKKTSAAWIPIMSGVAIVLAGLIIGASTGHSGRSKSRR